MKFMEAVGGIVAAAIKFSVLFSLYYLAITVKSVMKSKENRYHLPQKEYNVWRKRDIFIHGLLALMFFFLFLFSVRNSVPGMVISFFAVVIIYILRIRNNLSQIK